MNATAGLQNGFDPCKGILLTRLGRHYREKNTRVGEVNQHRAVDQEGYFSRSEGLQGFRGCWSVRIFFD
ncbi:hypothetical protein EMIT0232MI5_210030 [Pseudomonas sp. IT-232MI5]